MKTTRKQVLSLLLVLVCIFFLPACTKTAPTEENGLWEKAMYTENTSLGAGSIPLKVEVKMGDRSVVFTVNTDKTTVGAALMEYALIAGDEGEFGLYLKSVNGITADYDVDKSYWAFYINGEYAMTGVDKTLIEADAAYLLEYTK